MPFLPLIPQPNDQLSVSQGQILNNFTLLGPIAGNTNAGTASINGTVGFNFISLANQGGTVPNVGAGHNGIFSGNISLGGFQETWLINRATNTQIPMTNSILSSNPTPVAANRSWAYLPSGILLKWGQLTPPVLVNTYPVAIALNGGGDEPNFTTALGAFVNPTLNPGLRGIPFATITPPNLVVNLGAGNQIQTGSQGFNYLIIGY